MDDQKNIEAAMRLSDLATMLFGEEWAADVSRVAGINVRTVQRILADLREGQGNRSAAGVLRALREKVVNGLVEAEGVPAFRRYPIHDVAVAREIVGPAANGWDAALANPHRGPFDAAEFWKMIAQGQYIEQALYDLLNASIDWFNGPDEKKAHDQFLAAIHEAVETVDALVVLSDKGSLLRVRAPRPLVFGDGGEPFDLKDWPTLKGQRGIFFADSDPSQQPRNDASFKTIVVKVAAIMGALIQYPPRASAGTESPEPDYDKVTNQMHRWVTLVDEAEADEIDGRYFTDYESVTVDWLEHQ